MKNIRRVGVEFFKLLVMILVANITAFAQANPQKDEQAFYDKRTKLYAQNKVSEIKVYIVKTENDKLTDSVLFYKTNYDKHGNIIRQTRYIPNAGIIAKPHNIYTTDFEYDRNGNITKSTQSNEFYSISGIGSLVKWQSAPHDNLVQEYYYNNRKMLVKQIYKTTIPRAYVGGYEGYVKNYTYDINGNLIKTVQYDPEGKLSSINTYKYNKKNEMTEEVWYTDSLKNIFYRASFIYTDTAAGLIKYLNEHNGSGKLMTTLECDYDSRGNQVKQYNVIIGDMKKLILDNKFNDQNQLIESIGAPMKDKDRPIEDIRDDGRAHLCYAYDSGGLLTEIKKFGIDKGTGKEVLTKVEKLIYKKY